MIPVNAQPARNETVSSELSSPNSSADVECRRDTNSFIINYSSEWQNIDDACVYFTPTLDIFSTKEIEPYVRISVTDLGLANMSRSQLKDNVGDWSDKRYFFRIAPPKDFKLNGSDAFIIQYRWSGSSLAALPYVNQFPDLPETSETQP